MSVLNRRERFPGAPLERSYWVVPGKFLAGAYPGDLVRGRAEEKLRLLISAGIRVFVDLTCEGDRNLSRRAVEPYDDILARLGEDAGCSIQYCRRPIVDMDVPSREEMRETLDLIDAALAGDRPVFVHCLGGIGRTGTVVGCWLVRQGRASGEDVMELIRELRVNEPYADIPSPESHPQRQFVSAWRKGD